MGIKELHRFFVQEGIKEDPRGEDRIEEQLKKRKEKFGELEGVRKEAYDKDRLDNPFDDTKVLFDSGNELSKIAVGIDMEVQELLLLDRLNEKDEGIDGVISHHPEGIALARLHEVMGLQIDVLSEGGIPISQAEALVRPRSDEIKKAVHPRNHPRTPTAAELLGFQYMTLHTPADNHAYNFVDEYLSEKNPETLEDVVSTLLEIPEYEWSLKYGMEPQIHSGKDSNRAGKIGVFGFTGGTDLGEDVIKKMAESGIDTLVAMHAPKDQIKKADEYNINIVTAGHMPSDSLGLNLLLDKAEEKFDVDFFDMSGFKRVKRV